MWDGASAPLQQKYLPFGEPLHPRATADAVAKGFTNHEPTEPSGPVRVYKALCEFVELSNRHWCPENAAFARPMEYARLSSRLGLRDVWAWSKQLGTVQSSAAVEERSFLA